MTGDNVAKAFLLEMDQFQTQGRPCWQEEGRGKQEEALETPEEAGEPQDAPGATADENWGRSQLRCLAFGILCSLPFWLLLLGVIRGWIR